MASLVLASALVLAPTFAVAATERIRVAPGQVAARNSSHELFLEVEPLAGEGMMAFCRRVSSDSSSCREISRLNRNPRRLLKGVRYRVPYSLLTPELRLAVVRAIFRDDRAEPDGWVHFGEGESRGDVALWFTGDSRRTDALQPSGNTPLASGEQVRVAATALLPVFRALLPPAPAAAPEFAPVAAPAAVDEAAPLEYGEDPLGAYAVYRLRAGEALYSAVVVRLTGRDRAEDVNALAVEIAARSDIPDVTDIPVGYPVRIPLDLLLPQYLPANDPRRLEWEVERKLAEQFRVPEQARGLAGVTVILDAGHGGADVGASRAGVWESIYVYDVAERIRRSLQRRTLARVETTTRDGNSKGPTERDVLPYSRDHAVMTTPPYPISDAYGWCGALVPSDPSSLTPMAGQLIKDIAFDVWAADTSPADGAPPFSTEVVPSFVMRSFGLYVVDVTMHNFGGVRQRFSAISKGVHTRPVRTVDPDTNEVFEAGSRVEPGDFDFEQWFNRVSPFAAAVVPLGAWVINEGNSRTMQVVPAAKP